jgi:hypothetical protein
MTQVSRVPCPQCGESVEVGTTFCPNCGYYLDWSRHDEDDSATDADMMRRPEETVAEPLPPPPPPPSDTTLELAPQVICSNCGEGNEQSRTFCRRCGTALQGQAPPPPPAPPPPNPRLWWPYVAGAGALVVLVAIFLATRGGDGNEPGPTAAPTTVPQATAGTVATTSAVVSTTLPLSTTSPPTTAPGAVVALDGEAVAERTAAPKSIDANGDDWTEAVIHTTPHVIFVQRLVRDGEVPRAGSQNEAEVRLAWDDEHLYLLAVVVDDIHSQPNVGNQIWHGDAVDVNIAAGGPGSGASLRPNDDDFQVTLSPGDPSAGTAVESVVFIGAGQSFGPDEVGLANVAATIGSGGYTLEARIPWSAIGVDAPAAGQRLGFLLSIFDNDGEVGEFLTGRDGALQTEIVANTPGAGFQDPQTWGALTLQG